MSRDPRVPQWRSVLSDAAYVQPAREFFESGLGIAWDAVCRERTLLLATVDDEHGDFPIDVPCRAMLWAECMAVSWLIEHMADDELIVQWLFRVVAGIESWASDDYWQFPPHGDERAMMLAALDELQRSICIQYNESFRYLTGAMIWISGSGTPVRNAAAYSRRCVFGYDELVATIAATRSVVTTRELMSDFDRRIFDFTESTIGALDPLAAVLLSRQYDDVLSGVSWYGYHGAAALMGTRRELPVILRRFPRVERDRIVAEILHT